MKLTCKKYKATTIGGTFMIALALSLAFKVMWPVLLFILIILLIIA